MEQTLTYNKHEIYGILKDYHWMLKEIQRIDYELSKVEFKGTAQYGIAATLPTGKGIVGKALENEVVRRNEKSTRLSDYIDKVNFLNKNRHKVTNEKEIVILDCLLDGVSISAIARLFQTGRKQINISIDNIIDKIADY